MDERMVCPCGLTCCDCLFYKSEIYDAARALRQAIRRYEFDRFLLILDASNSAEAIEEHFGMSDDQKRGNTGQSFDAFKNVPQFLKVLDAIAGLQCKATCREAGGCSSGGDTHACAALKCVRSKGYDGCWQCADFELCDKLTFLKKSYGHVIVENLSIAKEKGVGAVESRGNQYYAWQRKKV